MATKVMVAYEQRPDDLRTIFLAVTSGVRPSPDSWQPAYRDTVGGKRVVWAKFTTASSRVTVWLRDANGERSVRQINP